MAAYKHYLIGFVAGCVLLVCAVMLLTPGQPEPASLPHTSAMLPAPVYQDISRLVPNTLIAPQMLPRPPVSALSKQKRIAIVIDDVAVSPPDSRRVLALPAPITVSILPYAPQAQAFADLAIKRGHGVMLHLPMQPRGDANPGRHALYTHLTPAEITARTLWNLSQFKGYSGVNNHMGSQFTAHLPGLLPVMAQLKAHDLFFLDSKTTGSSQTHLAAARHRVPWLSRDVFIDHVDEMGSILKQLAQIEQVAQRQGQAIAIGHPRKNTIAALRKWLPSLRQKGFTLVKIDALLTTKMHVSHHAQP